MTVKEFIEKLLIFKNDNTSYCISLWKDGNTQIMYFYIGNEDQRQEALKKADKYLDCKVVKYSLGYDSIGLTVEI